MNETDVPQLLERLGVKARRVANRPSGKFEGKCPFPEHDWKSKGAPWYIRDEPGKKSNGWHACQSCGVKGGILKLVEIVLGCSVEEAREFVRGSEVQKPLAMSVGIEVVAPKMRFQLPSVVRFEEWGAWPRAARDYLVNKRGWSEELVSEYGFGFVPMSAEEVVDGRLRPHRLHSRIVIPFRDATGRIVSYTARSWNPDNPKRYLEPRRTENADPGAVFGEDKWTGSEIVVVAEGSFDAVALRCVLDDRFDVGALAGSSLHPLQVQKLAKRRRLVISVTDPDRAGRKAALALSDSVSRTCGFVRVDLPPGKDPAVMALDDPSDLSRRVFRAAELAGMI